MLSINQPATTQFAEIPSFPDDLEVIIANIECRLLESLTPQQFTMVQHLMEATKMLTETEIALRLEAIVQRKSA